MKFSTREDIEAPIDQVFEYFTTFETFERQAIRRGADVVRVGEQTDSGLGTSWDAAFRMRGKMREMRLTVETFDRPNHLGIAVKSKGIDGLFSVELIALSRTRTRMAVALDLRPLNLSARLLVQSLRLAKGTLTKRFKLRVADFAKTVEDRLARS